MQKYNLLLSLLLLLLLTSACMIKIRGIHNEYESAYENAPAIMECAEKKRPLCTAKYEKKCPIVTTSAQPLLACLQTKKQAIVYEWSYRCKSELCYLLPVIQAWCKERNVTLYVLAEYYNMHYMQQPYDLEHPILAIDHKYYETNRVQKHFKLFYQELIGRERDKKEWGRLLYFQHGEFQGFYQDLKVVDSLLTASAH